LIRYFVVATAIVLAVAILATAWQYRDEIAVRVRLTSAPTAANGGVGGGTSGDREPFQGQGAWALSAVPDCLRQKSQSRGSIAYVRSKMPAGAVEVPPGDALHYGPCTIFVSGGEVVVARGQDRLAVPPHATLYRADGLLVLLRTSGASGDLRVYSSP
jgi:hypothetical protein